MQNNNNIYTVSQKKSIVHLLDDSQNEYEETAH